MSPVCFLSFHQPLSGLPGLTGAGSVSGFLGGCGAGSVSGFPRGTGAGSVNGLPVGVGAGSVSGFVTLCSPLIGYYEKCVEFVIV